MGTYRRLPETRADEISKANHHISRPDEEPETADAAATAEVFTHSAIAGADIIPPVPQPRELSSYEADIAAAKKRARQAR